MPWITLTTPEDCKIHIRVDLIRHFSEAYTDKTRTHIAVDDRGGVMTVKEDIATVERAIAQALKHPF